MTEVDELERLREVCRERERAIEKARKLTDHLQPGELSRFTISALTVEIAALILAERREVAQEIMDYAANDIERLYPRGPLVRWIRSRFLDPDPADNTCSECGHPMTQHRPQYFPKPELRCRQGGIIEPNDVGWQCTCALPLDPDPSEGP